MQSRLFSGLLSRMMGVGMLLMVAALTGCGKKDPVTASSSGLRPADDAGQGADVNSGDPGPATDVGDGSADRTAPPDDRPSGSAPSTGGVDELDDLDPPQGPPAEVAKHLEKLNNDLDRFVEQIQGQPLFPEAREALVKQLHMLLDARLTTAKQLLEVEAAKPEQRLLAAAALFDTFSTLGQLGEHGAAEQAAEYATKLAEDEDLQVRREAVAILLDAEIDQVRGDEKSDPAKMIQQLKFVLDGSNADLTPDRFMLAQSVVETLLSAQKMEQGIELMRLIGERFSEATRPDLVEAGKSLLDQSNIIELDFALRRVHENEPKASEQFVAVTKKLLSNDQLDIRSLRIVGLIADQIKSEHPETHRQLVPLMAGAVRTQLNQEGIDASAAMLLADLASTLGDDFADLAQQAEGIVLADVNERLDQEPLDASTLEGIFRQVATQAEYSGNIALAEKVYGVLEVAVKKVSDPDLASTLQGQLDDAQKRVGLIGKPLKIVGETVTGEPLDWSAYEGKVVLVDFWATWCEPCLREIPNIRANYQKYHDLGFEVIGVNVDDQVSSVKEFFAAQGEFPWTTVVSSTPEARGIQAPLARECGVSAIPFVLLIGKDGNVKTIHVRGSRLSEELAAIFGEVPDVNDDDASSDETVPSEDEVPADGEASSAESPALRNDATVAP